MAKLSRRRQGNRERAVGPASIKAASTRSENEKRHHERFSKLSEGGRDGFNVENSKRESLERREY